MVSIKTPRIHFDISFEGQVWRMVYGPDKETLFLEIRAVNPSVSSFSAIEIDSGKLRWTHAQVDEPRWIAISMVVGHRLILHSYEGMHNPNHKDLYALDTDTGKCVWKHEAMMLLKADENTLEVRPTGEEESRWVEINRGQWVAAPIPTQEGGSRPLAENNPFLWPFHYQQDSDYFHQVKEFVLQKTGWEVVKAVDYAQTDRAIFISCYIYLNEVLANYLLIFDRQGNEMFRECLGEGLTAPGTDTFFVREEKCFFVKNRNQFTCISLE
jgi:hypothetical protein